MSRKGKAVKREILPDARFSDVTVQRVINKLTLDGKKSVSEAVFYGAMDIIAEKSKDDALEIFKKAIENLKPQVEVKSRRVGGATYQVPVEVRPERRLALAIRWLITYSRARNDRGMANKLASEMMDAANNRGSSVKKREDVHKMAEANKAFAHYRW